MISPWPVTSANITVRATGLAELIVAMKTAPLAVRIPNGTPPPASAFVAIHSVSGRPSPSTSTVGLDCAPCGIARPTDGQPAFAPPPLLDAAAEELPALDGPLELPAAELLLLAVLPPCAQPARRRPAIPARAATRREVMPCTLHPRG